MNGYLHAYLYFQFSCYKMVKDSLPWVSADEACSNLHAGGHLASIQACTNTLNIIISLMLLLKCVDTRSVYVCTLYIFELYIHSYSATAFNVHYTYMYICRGFRKKKCLVNVCLAVKSSGPKN